MWVFVYPQTYYTMDYTKCQYVISDNTKYIIDDVSGELREVLVDCSSNGHVNPFSRNKQQNLYLSSVYQNIASVAADNNNKFLDCDCSSINFSKTFNKLTFCTNYLEFVHLKDKTKHISYLESCHKSLCPCCNFFRARSDLRSLFDIFTEFFNNPIYKGCQFLFLTLTIPSVYSSDLNSALDLLSDSYHRFIKSKEFRSAFLGSSRSLELTYNNDVDSKSYNMVHPHLHILLVARPDYFKSSAYLDYKYILYLWQRALHQHKFRSFDKWLTWYTSFWENPFTDQARKLPGSPELTTQINIKKIKFRSVRGLPAEKIAGAMFNILAEVLKYPFKSDELLTGNIDIDSERVFFLDSALYHRRRWQVSGCLKDIAKKLHIPDDEDSDLVSVAGLDLDQIEYFSGWWFSGKFGEYIRGHRKNLTEKNAVRRLLGLPLLSDIDKDKLSKNQEG